MTLRMNMDNVNQFKDVTKILSERSTFFSNGPPSDGVLKALKNNAVYNKLIELKKYFQQFIDNPAASATDQADADSYMKILNPILTKFEVYRAEHPTELVGGRKKRRTKKINNNNRRKTRRGRGRGRKTNRRR
jgi:hypothetical protein